MERKENRGTKIRKLTCDGGDVNVSALYQCTTVDVLSARMFPWVSFFTPIPLKSRTVYLETKYYGREDALRDTESQNQWELHIEHREMIASHGFGNHHQKGWNIRRVDWGNNEGVA